MSLIKSIAGYFLVLILIFIVIPPAQSLDAATMSKPIITTGSEVSEGEPITMSSTLKGQFTTSDWNNLISILPGNRVLNLIFDIELYEYGYGLLDKKIGEVSVSHIARFSQLGDVTVELTEKGTKQAVYNVEEFDRLMRNLIDIPVGTVSSDKSIYVKVRAKCNLEGDWIFDPFGLGYQKNTGWSNSDVIGTKVVSDSDKTKNEIMDKLASKPKKILPVPYCHQGDTPWCALASMAMLYNYHDASKFCPSLGFSRLFQNA